MKTLFSFALIRRLGLRSHFGEGGSLAKAICSSLVLFVVSSIVGFIICSRSINAQDCNLIGTQEIKIGYSAPSNGHSSAINKNNQLICVYVDGSNNILLERINPDGTLDIQKKIYTAVAGNDIGSAHISIDDMGNYIISWFSFLNGQPTGLIARLFDASNNQVGEDVIIESTFTQFGGNNQISMNNSGHFASSWETFDGICLSLYDSTGTRIKDKISAVLNIGWEGSDGLHTIKSDNDGNIVIAWVTRDRPDKIGIFGKIYDKDGNIVKDEFQISDIFSRKPDISVLNDGTFRIVYARFNKAPGDNNRLIVMQRLDYNGNKLQADIEIDISDEGQYFDSPPKISSRKNIGYGIVWIENGERGEYSEIYTQLFSIDDKPIGNVSRVNEYTKGTQFLPNIVMSIDGLIAISWNSWEGTWPGPFGEHTGIFGRIIRPVCVSPTQLQIYHPAKVQFVEMQPDVQAQLFNKDFGTIVMTHGWNGGEPSSGWMVETARVLYARMGETVNILAWDWFEKAGTIHLAQATMNILPQSRLCAKELQKVLSLDYNKPVHFMGHSLGAFLMANVCEMTLPLRPKVGDKVVPTHLTLWDPPDVVKNDLGNQTLRLRKTGVYADLISGSADNKAYFVNAWIDVPSSERNLLNFYHDVYLWYQNHATLAENPLLFGNGCNLDQVDKNIGFNASVLFETGANPMDFTCLPPNGPVSTSYICHIDSCDRLNYRIFGLACVDDKTPEKKITGIILSTGECFGSCELPSDTKALLKKAVAEGGGGDVAPDTTFTLTQTIDLQWDYISFTYEFSEIGNSQLMLSIKSDEIETPIWLDNAVTDKGPSDSGLINVQEYRGKTVDLIFGFIANTDASTVAISDISFWQDPFHDNVAPIVLIEDEDLLAILAQGESTAIALDATNSTDPNDDSLSFIWENKDGVIDVQPRVELNLALGAYQYTVTVRDPFDGITQKIILREIEYEFRRGDANQDGDVNITDPIAILGWLFLGDTQGICKDAADSDDDGNINISDPIAILNFLFLGGEAPKEPFNQPGLDPTPDFLGCTIKAE